MSSGHRTLIMTWTASREGPDRPSAGAATARVPRDGVSREQVGGWPDHLHDVRVSLRHDISLHATILSLSWREDDDTERRKRAAMEIAAVSSLERQGADGQGAAWLAPSDLVRTRRATPGAGRPQALFRDRRPRLDVEMKHVPARPDALVERDRWLIAIISLDEDGPGAACSGDLPQLADQCG